jgi:hypothetical protein
VVQQLHQPPAETFTYGLPQPTVAVVPEVPDKYRPLAAALCEPLLLGGRLPAAYGQVMTRLGLRSLRRLRNDVEQLCDLYTSAAPQFAQRVEDRKRRQREALGEPPVPVRHGAIFGFETVETPAEPPAAGRAKSLSLPDYYEVAVLLVQHYRITVEDLRLLPRQEVT